MNTKKNMSDSKIDRITWKGWSLQVTLSNNHFLTLKIKILCLYYSEIFINSPCNNSIISVIIWISSFDSCSSKILYLTTYIWKDQRHTNSTVFIILSIIIIADKILFVTKTTLHPQIFLPFPYSYSLRSCGLETDSKKLYIPIVISRTSAEQLKLSI